MSITHWEHRRKELLWSIGILTFLVLAEAVVIIITDGERLLPIAGACIAAVFLVYEIVQYDLHMRKKDQL
jgi:hypothetical protein